MAKLKNTFSWSITRGRIFVECPRKYYYHYYGSWEGWDELAPESARLCYRLKQIVNLKMWCGDIVHRVIETALKRIRQGHPIDIGKLQSQARNIMNGEWKESTENYWTRHPKKYRNLFEHYYGREISGEDRVALRELVFGCLTSFEGMGYAEQLRAISPERWRTIEDLQSFDISGIKTWIKIDCAVEREDNLVIYDWKTGKLPQTEGPSDQQVCYALFATQQWGLPLESLRVSEVYLAEKESEMLPVNAEQIIDFRERLLQSADQMMQRLADPKRNIASEADFPRTQNTSTCKRCEFFEICYGDRSLVPPESG